MFLPSILKSLFCYADDQTDNYMGVPLSAADILLMITGVLRIIRCWTGTVYSCLYIVFIRANYDIMIGLQYSITLSQTENMFCY